MYIFCVVLSSIQIRTSHWGKCSLYFFTNFVVIVLFWWQWCFISSPSIHMMMMLMMTCVIKITIFSIPRPNILSSVFMMWIRLRKSYLINWHFQLYMTLFMAKMVGLFILKYYQTYWTVHSLKLTIDSSIFHVTSMLYMYAFCYTIITLLLSSYFYLLRSDLCLWYNWIW